MPARKQATKQWSPPDRERECTLFVPTLGGLGLPLSSILRLWRHDSCSQDSGASRRVKYVRRACITALAVALALAAATCVAASSPAWVVISILACPTILLASVDGVGSRDGGPLNAGSTSWWMSWLVDGDEVAMANRLGSAVGALMPPPTEAIGAARVVDSEEALLATRLGSALSPLVVPKESARAARLAGEEGESPQPQGAKIQTSVVAHPALIDDVTLTIARNFGGWMASHSS